MKKLLLLIILFFTVVMVNGKSTEESKNTKGTAPLFSLKNLEGGEFHLADVIGKKTILKKTCISLFYINGQRQEGC